MIGDFFGAIFQPGSHGLWIMIIGSMAGAACGLAGVFLAMVGDAISHAVLPGIVVAFLFTGGRNILPMLAGAGALGLASVLLTDVLHRKGKLQADAALGVTFTAFFAVGVILISRFAGSVELDLDCVLFGEILYAPLDPVTVAGVFTAPRAAWSLGIALLATTAFVLAAWKELKVSSFDPGLALSMGINVVVWHYLLMAVVSVTTVAAFESVGAILVIAMLVAPPNAAYLLTDRLWLMALLSVVFGVLSAIVGYGVAAALDSSIAGAMASVAGLIYALAAVFGPRHGMLPRMWRHRQPLAPPPPAE